MTKGGAILGIDTSGTRGSVAVLSGRAGQQVPGAVLAGEEPGSGMEECFSEGMIHGVALAPTVKDLLDRIGIRAAELGLIAVGLGPGSYTGVRVGVSFAKTLAFTTGVPIIGVSSLEAIALNAPPDSGPVICARDARRDTLYVASFLRTGDGLAPDLPLALLPLEGIQARLPADALVLGDALDRFGNHLSGDGRIFGEPELWHAGAMAIARLGYTRGARPAPGEFHDLTPIYLRKTEAEERWAEREKNS